MKKYIKIMRLDHWIKQFFVFPGVICACALTETPLCFKLFFDIFITFIATCFIASSNYVINEWLDASFDKFHPTKKYRSVVENNLDARIVYLIYFVCAIIGCILRSSPASFTE